MVYHDNLSHLNQVFFRLTTRAPCLCIRFFHFSPTFSPFDTGHTSATPWAKVGMVIAAVAASFGFHPGLDQTIFMARLGAGAAGLGLALGRLEMVKQQEEYGGSKKHDWRTSKCWNMIRTYRDIIYCKGIVGRYRNIMEHMGTHILWDLDSGGVFGINDDFYSKNKSPNIKHED